MSADLEQALQRRVKVQGTTSSDTFLGNSLKKALDAAEAQAGKLKDEYVSTEHLLLGLLAEGGAALKKIFQAHGLKRDDVLKALAELRGNQRVTDPNPEDKFQALEKYGRDLTALARAGQDRSGHRPRRGNPPRDAGADAAHEEQSRCSSASRAWARRPLPKGWPGASSAATCRNRLKNKRLVAMDLSAMIAGAKYRGEFEDRLKAFLKEITASEGQDHPVHRRIAHARRRGRGGRRGGRGEHAQAAAGARRVALHRRDHAG